MKKRNYLLLTAVPVLSALAFTASAGVQTTTPSPATGMATHQYNKMGKMGMHKGGNMGMNNTKDIASILGMTETDVATALSSGKTLPTLVTERGMTLVAFQEKMKALRETAMKSELAAQVTSGKITQAKADEIIANHTKRVADMKALGSNHMGHPERMRGDHTEDAGFFTSLKNKLINVTQ